MKTMLITLPLFLGCAAQSSQPVEPQPKAVSNALPFGVVMLPLVLDSEIDPLTEQQITTALLAAFEDDVFVSVAQAADYGEVETKGANYVLKCEYRTTGGIYAPELRARFYSFGLSKELDDSDAGLALTVETQVIGDDWVSASQQLVALVRQNSAQLLEPGLTPFGLDTSSLRFTTRGARPVLNGEVAFTPSSRSTRVRSIFITMPSGERIELTEFANAGSDRLVGFESELPEIQSGDVLNIEIVAGSRVNYRRRYAVRVP